MESKRREEFGAIYQEHRIRVFQTALMYTRNSHDAEDITQEAFMRYYVYSAHSMVKSPKAWLMVTASNLACNYKKHARYEKPTEQDELMELVKEYGPDASEVFFDRMWKLEIVEYTDRVLEAVKSKNKNWYDALIYAYCMEMPRQEIAESMGITVDALQGLLRRAKDWIKKNYRDEYDHITRI